MSCQLIDQKAIANVLSKVTRLYEGDETGQLDQGLLTKIGVYFGRVGRQQKFIRAVCRMNHNAFNIRYRYEEKGFKFSLNCERSWCDPSCALAARRDLAQLIQSLNYILYQCAEGEQTQKSLYKFIQKIIADLQNYYFYFRGTDRRSPKFESLLDECEWGAI